MARTPKARALGNALRSARTEKQLTLRELGERIGRQSGELCRWEKGERPVGPDRVAQILTALGINGERFEEIVALSQDAKKTPPWAATTLPERNQQLAALIDFERSATSIVDVSPLLVPGLLQESGYIQAIMSAGGNVPPSEIPTRIALRLGRKEILTRFARPVPYLALLGESVLHQRIGDRAVMAAQLRHLLEMNQRPNVTVRIIPYVSGWNPALEGPFTLIESRQSTPVVQLENRRSTFLLHEREDITAYARAVAQLEEIALTGADTLKALTATLRRWEQMP